MTQTRPSRMPRRMRARSNLPVVGRRRLPIWSRDVDVFRGAGYRSDARHDQWRKGRSHGRMFPIHRQRRKCSIDFYTGHLDFKRRDAPGAALCRDFARRHASLSDSAAGSRCRRRCADALRRAADTRRLEPHPSPRRQSRREHREAQSCRARASAMRSCRARAASKSCWKIHREISSSCSRPTPRPIGRQARVRKAPIAEQHAAHDGSPDGIERNRQPMHSRISSQTHVSGRMK